MTTATVMTGEDRIGRYRVHPVASLFPLLEGEEFRAFKESVRIHGQQEAIVVQNDTLLDGRNRLRVCVDLGIEPQVREYGPGDTEQVTQFIVAANIQRRHLSDIQRIKIAAQAQKWIVEDNHKRQIEGRREGGKKAGRGRPNRLVLKSGPTYRPSEAKNKTNRQIARLANTSRNKVDQVLNLIKHNATELMERVDRSEITLEKADEQVREAPPSRIPAAASQQGERPFHGWNMNRAIARSVMVMSKRLQRCPADLQDEFKARFTAGLNFTSDHFISGLLKEIRRRRKEVNAPRPKGHWNPDPISKLELIRILDWIEDELSKIAG